LLYARSNYREAWKVCSSSINVILFCQRKLSTKVAGSDRIRIILGSRIRIRSRAKNGSGLKSILRSRSLRDSKWSQGVLKTITMEAWRLKMEMWRVCRPMVADSHHFDEEQDADPEPDLH
jgi:hypothetical protein